jgi:hypothetical protein
LHEQRKEYVSTAPSVLDFTPLVWIDQILAPMWGQSFAFKSRLQAPATPRPDWRWHVAVKLDPEIIKWALGLGRPTIVGLRDRNNGRHK